MGSKPVLFILLALSVGTAWGQTLSVLTPNGGENWPSGETRIISWQAAGISGNVRIVLDRNGAKVGDIAVDVPATQQSFSWTVAALAGGGAAPAGGGYRVRIRAMGTETSDSSNADFRIYRQVSVSQPGRPDVQVSQNQPPDTSGITGMPDLAFQHVYYYFIDNTLVFDVVNLGLAPYSGDLDVRMEVDGGGCHTQTLRLHAANLTRGNTLEKQSFHCDFFPDPCRYRFRLVLEALSPEERRDNNVFDEIVYKYVANGSFRLGVQVPIRLRFTRVAKSLTCSYYAYNADNTVFRDDVLNDYAPGGRSVMAFLEVPVRNCCRQAMNSNMILTIEYRRGGTERTTLYQGNLANENFSIPPGEERLITRALTLPIQPGEFFIAVSNPIGSGIECQVAFRFASEFFD